MASAELIQWSDKRRIGIPELDEQHQAMVSMLNELHLAIIGRNARETSRTILERLAEYPARHFPREEDLMQRVGYSGLDAHREQHEELARQVIDLRERLDAGGNKLTFELLHFLKTWLAQHIHESDRRFGAFIATTEQFQSHTGHPGHGNSRTEQNRGWWQSIMGG